MAFESSREGQLTEDKLNWGYWWLNNKVRIRRIVTGALIALDVVLVGYGAFGFADWFFGSGVAERRLIAQLSRPAIDYAFFRQKFAPADLRTESAQALEGGTGSYDFIARAINPNPHWWVTFDYRFASAAGETATKSGYLLPGDVQWLDALGVKSETRPGAARLIVENVLWHRVDLHEIRPDYATWSRQRLNFRIEEAAFVPPTTGDALAISRAKFVVTNDTGFGYYRTGFFVTLFSGARVVAVNRVVLSELRAGERRPVEVSWFSDLPGVTKVEVRPLVNVFDEKNVIPPGM